jgi:hypothetical protein
MGFIEAHHASLFAVIGLLVDYVNASVDFPSNCPDRTVADPVVPAI